MQGLANFISSDLTWRGSKGYRSSSRLARKSVSRSLKGSGELFDQNSKTVNMPVCESEKLGVKVLGCRFSENVEHVPIKKRRFVYRSPSPPSRDPSPHSEEADTRRFLKIEPGIIDSAAASASKDARRIVDIDCDVNEPNLKRVTGRVDENEDFSGISILAAAADGLGVEEYFVSDCSTNNESCSLPTGLSMDDLCLAKISTKQTGLPSEELAACLRIGKLTASDLSHEEIMKGTSLQDHPVTSNDLSTSKDEETVRKQESFARDDRLYWDLNAPLDSWEHHFDYQVADSNTNVVDGIAEDVNHGDHSNKVGNFEGYELPSNPDDCKGDAGKELVPSDSVRMAPESSRSSIKDLKTDVCINSERSNCLQDSLLSSELDCAVTADQRKQKLHGQGRTSAGAGAGSVLVPIDDAKRVLMPNNEDKNNSEHDVSIVHSNNKDGLSLHEDSYSYSCADGNLLSKPRSCYTSAVYADEIMSISSGFHIEKEEVASLVALSGKTTGEVWDGVNNAVDDSKEISGSLDGTRNAADIVALGIKGPLNTRCNVTEHHSGSAPLGVEITKSATSVEDHPALAVDLKVQCVTPSVDGDAKADTLVHIDEEEPSKKCMEKSAEMLQAPTVHSSHDMCGSDCDDPINSYDDTSLEEPLDNDCYSDVSHGCAHVKLSELAVDYDSQYEDGEVRGSIVHAWEEYDNEDVEAEHVDYGSDDGNSLSYEAEKRVNHTQETILQPHPSSSLGFGKERSLERIEGRNEVETGHEAGLGKVTEDVVAREDDMRKPSLSADSTEKVSGDHGKYSDAMTGAGDGSSRKKLTDDCVDAMDCGSAKTKMVGSREFRRELRSHIEGRQLCGIYFKDKMYAQGSSDANNSNFRSERATGYVPFFNRLRYTQHPHARDEEGDRWVNSSHTHRGLKRYYSSNYRRPTSFHHPGPENGYVNSQKMDASSLSVHWRLTRSGLPGDRDEAFRLRLGFRPSRELSPDRRIAPGRGRSLRYDPRLDARGLRGRYHGPIPDDCSGPSLIQSHPSAKRERSFSPIERSGKDSARKSHSKSPPRSRTRSPISANPSSRQRSKSPTLRSGVRMQRGRPPHQQSGIEADRMVGFRSVHRFHGSPPRNSRWTGDWKDDMVHFRERTRFSPRDERFEFVGPPRNCRSMHIGRFPDIEGVGRGQPWLERSDDNRERHGYRFALAPPAKRYEMDGAVKQFRYNCDEGFVKTRNSRYRVATDFHGRGSPKEFGRSIESSGGDDVPRRFREERGPFIHRRDGKHNANSKSFGMRENDDNVDSLRRPS